MTSETTIERGSRDAGVPLDYGPQLDWIGRLTHVPVYNDALAKALAAEHIGPLVSRETLVRIIAVITEDEIARIKAHNAVSGFQPGWPLADAEGRN